MREKEGAQRFEEVGQGRWVAYKGVLVSGQFPHPPLTQQWLPCTPALLEVLG